jgi:YD repeat-containing protein
VAPAAQGQLISIVWQDGSVRRYHHEDGRWPQAATGITDEASARYGAYAYDAQGRVTRSELAGGAEPNKTTANTYSSKGLLTGASWTATTDATGAAKFTAVKTGSTYATGYGYNESSLLTSLVEKIDTTTVAQMNYTVNAAGNATKATNPITGKSTTSATYDAHGRLVREVDPYGTITVSYSPRGFVLEEKDETATTSVKHNAIGLVTEVNTGTGLIYRWTYNSAHTLIGVSLNDVSLVALGSPARGRKSLFDFFISTAHAQTAGLPLPGGVPGLRGPGWIGAGMIAWEVGKRLRESSQQSSQNEEKKPECDPCDDPNAKLQWTSHGNKHFPPPRVSWDRIVASTSGGGRAYYHPTVVPNHAAQAAFELAAWATGKPSKIRKGYRYQCFPGRVIGASDGAETSCVRIECTSPGVVHGHPVPRAEYTSHTGVQ